MADLAFSVPRSAEISERSSELVLPEETVSTASPTVPGQVHPRSLRAVSSRTSEREVGVNEAGPTQQPGPPSSQPGSRPESRSEDRAEAANVSGDATPPNERGIALPGDRKPRKQPARAQRPSFWRRIALGRRAHRHDESPSAEPAPASASSPELDDGSRAAVLPTAGAAESTERGLALRDRLEPSRAEPIDPAVLEQRIVAPMLQALVSIEAKLERSHSDLSSRADGVEQRLTQLWDIEEQLGALGDVQESLAQVSEQQRRLESAVVSQTRTIRWLVGAVFVSLAAAAFVVAALVR